MPSQLTFNYGKVLTLCISARNQALFVKQQLQRLSLLDASIQERIETIIVDNDSSDGTSSLVKTFEGHVPFSYVSNTENLSVDNSLTFALNKAISTKSKYIWMLDARNIVRIEHFEALLELLDKNETGLVHLASKERSRKQSASYIDTDDFLQSIGIGIVEVSRNIIRTDYIKGYNPRTFGAGSGIPAVPLFLYVSLAGRQNYIYNPTLFDDAKINYIQEANDPIRTFVKHLTTFYTYYEDERLPNSISPVTTMKLKSKVSDYLLPIILRLFILRKGTRGADPKASRNIVKRHLGWRPLTATLRRCVSGKIWGRFARLTFTILRKMVTIVAAGLTILVCNTVVTRACTRFKNSLTTYRFRYRIKVGKGCDIEGPVFTEGKNIAIGSNFSSRSGLRLESLSTGTYTPKIIIGDDVSIERNVRITAIREIRIGKGVKIGSNVTITDYQYGKTTPDNLRIIPADRQMVTRGAVQIEDNVLIGPGATILAGVTIGKGAVIGAGAVVTRNIPPLSVALGVPARIKQRNNP